MQKITNDTTKIKVKNMTKTTTSASQYKNYSRMDFAQYDETYIQSTLST